jgi:hypothetical protein
MRKAIGVIALMVLPLGAATVGFVGTAAAATGVSCTKLTGKATGSKGTVSGCTDTANTGGSGTFNPSSLLSGGKITWAKKVGTTTIDNVNPVTVTPNKCPKGDTEYEITADIESSTGKTAKSIKDGWTLQVYVCLNNTTEAFSILKGTKLEIGAKY